MKKRIAVIVLSILMMICMLPATAMAADTWDGTSVDTSWYNTTDTEFTIDTAAELAGLAQIVNDGGALIDDPKKDDDYHYNFQGATITLGGDIDLGGYEWTPIGYYDPSGIGGWQVFSGTFDGGGHTISGLAIGTADAPNTSLYMAGLFAEMNNLENLNVESDGIYSVYSEGSIYGGFVGVLAAAADGSVTNCTATGDVTGGYFAYVGGLAGSSGGDMTNCHATGNVVGGNDSKTGGLIGQFGGGTLTDCYATGDITGSNCAGGLIGECNSHTISNCYATGDVTCSGSFGGGFAGFLTLTESISGCYAAGNVTASVQDAWIGGFAGFSTNGTMTDCCATGNVQFSGSGVTNTCYVGGFVGYSMNIISQCFAFGNVTNTGSHVDIGGFVGFTDNQSIDNCYAAGSVSSGNHNSCSTGGFIGYNAKHLQNCYARGAVSGSGTGTFIGGFAGSNGSGAILDNCYFDSKDSGVTAGIGQDSNSQTVTGLTPDKMTGSTAPGNITGFDFTAVWTAKANDSKWYFPQLTALSGSSDSVVKTASLKSVTLVPFTVTFDSNSGSAVDSEYGYYSAVNKPTDPTRTGHVFGGWYTDSDLTAAYDFGAAVTADITLYAKWTSDTHPSYFQQTLTDPGSGINITGNLIEGVKFSVTALDKASNDYKELEAALNDGQEIIFPYEITLSAGGNVPYSGTLILVFPVGTQYNGQTLTLLHRTGSGIERFTGVVANGTLTVTVNSLSPFAVAKSKPIGGLPESHTLYKGGRITWTPSPIGGTWQYDTAYLTATTSGGSTTFMAVKTGSTTVTYTVNGITHKVAVTILEAELPATGQDFTPVMWLLVSGLCVGLCAAFGFIILGIRKSRKERV